MRRPAEGEREVLSEATLDETAVPHTGCGKFFRRFGLGAMKFMNSPVGRES